MNCLPVLSYFPEHDGHAATIGFGRPAKSHRLGPLASYQGRITTQHRDAQIFYVELDVLHSRIRAFAVLLELVPASGYRAIVVEEHETWRVLVSAGCRLYVGVPDAV